MSRISFKHRRMMMREYQRMQFLLRRDGIEGAKVFALQGLNQYNNSLKTGYGKSYSDELRTSIIVYIQFLNYIRSRYVLL